MANGFDLDKAAQELCARLDLELIAPVGDGAFKRCYHARNEDAEDIALKVIRPGSQPERTDREIAAMQRFNHPHVVTLLSLGSETINGYECHYLIEPFYAGGTFEARLSAGDIDRVAALHVGKQISDAIRELERFRLVHRDIKPANVMFQDSGIQAVLVDFGIVRNLDESSLTKDWLTMGPGTPFFAAPEQLHNQKPLIGWRTDQFALGVMIGLAITGHHPYQHEGDSDQQIVVRVAEREGPTNRFRNACNEAAVPFLPEMVMPYPVQRITSSWDLIKLFEEA